VAKGASIAVFATTTSEKMATGLLYMAKVTRVTLFTALRTKVEFAGSLAMIKRTGVALITTVFSSHVTAGLASQRAIKNVEKGYTI
jgi:hypothetical protein